ncbi:dockerin type I repeat-containing protein [Ruminococcus albus]|uniref:Dockerin domain-containing protein n=1 Tax=Ruminococcus albus TaxID=1264 RepID=A0A1I1DWR6_RUMAL|nr:dockerin type I repeat-containing protein [Ruminococcus albus]SFB77150.1 hypothetical protein SAMN02910406_00479 [Ruminococcus albus]
MARNLSKDLKRLVAGLCAVLVVGGAVPLQPLVDFNYTIKAAADTAEPVFINYSPYIVSNGDYAFVQNDSTGLAGVGYRSNNQGQHGSTALTTFKVYPRNGQIVKVNWKISSEQNYDCMTITAGNSTPVSAVSGEGSGYFNITGTETSATDGITVYARYTKDSSVHSREDSAYIAFQIEQNKASLSFSGFTASTDYSVVDNVSEVRPGDTVTIYSNKKFNSSSPYTTLDFEKAQDSFEYNEANYKYRCTMTVNSDAVFSADETITFTEQPKVYMTFKDLEEAGYYVDYNSEGVYVTDYVDVYTNKRMYLDESIFDDGSTSAPPIRFVEYMKETTDGGFDVNNSKYLYRYHITFPQYPYIGNSYITFIAEKNVDLEFENMAENKKFAVEGDLPYAYVADGSVIYSDQTITGDISKVQLSASTKTGGYNYKDKNYKYKYDVTYSEELKTGDKVSFFHVHEYGNPHVDIEEKPDIIIADCTGEDGESVGTVEIAQLKPKDIYYYGDLPTVEEVVVKPEQMPNGITSIDPVSLSIKKKGKTTTQDYFTDFGTYELSAIVNVVCGGKTYPISITKDVEYSPRSLFGDENSSSTDEDYTGCQFFLRTYEEADEDQVEPEIENDSPDQQNPEQQNDEQQNNEQQNDEQQNDEQQENEQQQANYSEVPLVVKNGVITLPKDSFVYNKKEQKPVIVVKNKINGQVFELTEDEISSTVEGKTGANKDNEFYEFKISAVQPESEEAAPANYTGEVTVKWRIEKAPNNVTFVPKTDTVYDAEVLDDTDFTFTDPDDTLNDSNIKVEVKGKTTGTVNATSGDPYVLSSADNYNTLTHVEDASYVLPDNYTYTFIGKYMNGGSVKTVTGNVEQYWFGEIVPNDVGNQWRLYDKEDSNSRPIGFATITVVFNDTAHTADIICFENNDLYNQYMAKLGESSDITSAGIQKGTITITSDNYQDKVMDFETNIAKKEVTVAPNGIKDNDTNTITWGELIKDSDVLYSQDGVVDKDKPNQGDYNFGLIFTAENYNFEDASKNNVGEYKLVPSQIFAEYNAADNNYYLVLPKEETEEQEELAEPIYMLSTEQGEPGESEEITEDEPEEETEDVKLDTLTIVPYELTKANVSISDINYQFDTYIKNPEVKTTVPYSTKDSAEPELYELKLGSLEDHADKDFFVKGVRYDNIVGEKNIAVMTDETTNKNFTAGENGLEFKWYINNGTLSIEVSVINDKIYDGAAVAEPTVTVTNQIHEVVKNASTKIQYQKKDEESGEYGEAFDGEPKDAGTYRAVVTVNADSYDEAVTNSNEFTISKREVTVTLTGLPEVKGYNDKTVSYEISVADPENPDNNTGIVNNEINPKDTVDIEAGKQDGDHITNEDLPEIVERLGDNYTFTFDEVLNLRDARLETLVVYKAYMEEGETIDPNDYFAAYDENGKDITDKCKVINIDNIDQFGEYTIEVNDGSIIDPLTDVLYVKPKSDEIEERFADLPDPENVTVMDERLINDAREAYEALSDKQKENISEEELQKLVDAENALEAAKKAAADKEAADAVKKAINDLPAAEDVTVDDAEAIEDAREAFEALTDDQKALVDGDTMNKLDDAEAALEAAKKEAADKAAADAVKKAINDLPTAENVTVDDADAITAACEAFEALTGDQKNLVDGDTMKKLDDAVAALDTAKKAAEKAAEDQAAADAVKKAINDLPAAENVTVDDADAIAAVREAFEALTGDQKGLVDGDTMKKLDDAEAALDAAKKAAEKAAEDQAAADAVKKAINDLPAAENVTVDDADAIAAVREAFEALTDDQKGMVDGDTMKKLDDAEAALDTAKKAAEDQAAADAVKNAINALPAAEDLTKDDAEAIANARKLFDELTDEQKALIDPEVVKKLTDDETAVAAIIEESKYMKGDVNGDGTVNINDLTKVAAHVKGKRLLSEEEQKRADVNGDGKINVTDITQLAAHIKGKRLLK